MLIKPSLEHRCNRRQALRNVACGFGHTALMGMLAAESTAQSDSKQSTGLHHSGKAKCVIFLFMHGGVSHVDTFDPKPELDRLHGQPSPIKKPDFNFAETGTIFRSPWKFKNYGESGIPVSDLFPHIGSCVDDIAIVRSMNGDQVAHGGASLLLHTGDGVMIRPSLGAWTLYGLGSVNQNLPGFITLSPSTYHGGSQNYGAAFLPAVYQGTSFGDGNTAPRRAQINNLIPSESSTYLQRMQLDYLKKYNLRHLATRSEDARLQAQIESFELSFRMQMAAPEVFDLASETRECQTLYGLDHAVTEDFGYQCLIARRLAESGVRFIQINHSHPRNYWDAHGGLESNHGGLAPKVDKPIAALLTDLKRRGLLDETLVIWATEFGRTPAAQGSDGRDHHPHAFSIWMAGGGIRGGTVYGATDELGYYVTENKVLMKDFHATVLHLLGIDHQRLTYRYSGRDFRLTDVEGQVVHSILS
ncbi:MAG: DUF1501 domain-containing protein [Planctomycetota bacterium]|nr:DUF1501 domain-containing protein [Planctomycetota bacterium]